MKWCQNLIRIVFYCQTHSGHQNLSSSWREGAQSILASEYPHKPCLPWLHLTLTCKWPRGGPWDQDLFFAHFATFACAFFIVIFSNCLTFRYASFDAKKKFNQPCHFLANWNKLALLHNIRNLFWPPFWSGLIFLKCYFINVNLFMFPTLSQISLKNSFGKVVFQILAKIEMTWNKNQLFGRHF